jgi:hypothetical protein
VWTARILPSFLTAAPVLLLLSFVPDLALAAKFVPALAFAGMAVLAGEVSHTAGRRLQNRLIKKWDGLPTLAALRHRSSLPREEVRRNRRAVESISGMTLPTAAQERAHPERSDDAYRRAVRTCIDMVRSGQPGSGILFATNVSYGFRRNTRALKAYALAVTSGTLAAALILAYFLDRWDLGGVVAGASVLAGLAWIFVVRHSWVLEGAQFYAEQFFRTLDSSTFVSRP